MSEAPARRGFGSIAVLVAALTLVSRILGFGRSLVFSKTVGDTCLGDAYNAANTLPNVLFEVVAGGVLAGVVVPVVTRHLAAGRRDEAARTSSALLTWTLVVLTPAALAAFLGASLYGAALAKPSCPGSGTTIAALLVMFVPQIWLYGLAVVSAGILQAHRRFLAAALAPLLSSVVVIGAYLAFAALAVPAARGDLGRLGETARAALGWGTTAGVVALALTTAIPMARTGRGLRPRLGFAAGDRPVIAAIAAAGIGGLLLQQLSLVLINWSTQQTGDPGALTRFTWANAIYLLPYAVLVAPLLQLSFPRLAAAAEEGGDALRAALAESGPALLTLGWLGAAALAAVAVPVARVFVLGPGSGATDALAWPIAALGPAVLGFSVLGLASRALLAEHRARAAGGATMAGWGTVIVAVLVLRPLVAADHLVVAVAAATSFGMLVGATAGLVALARGHGHDHLVGWARRPLLVGAAAALVAGGLAGWLGRLFGGATLGIAVLGALGTGLACLLLFAAVVFLLDRGLLRQVLAAAGRRTVSA